MNFGEYPFHALRWIGANSTRASPKHVLEAVDYLRRACLRSASLRSEGCLPPHSVHRFPSAASPITTVGRRAWVSAPDPNHRHYRRHNGHADANESHRPDQRQIRCDDQHSSQQPEHHPHPEQVLHKLSARTPKKMPRRAHGHHLLHQSGVSAPCHDTEVAYPLVARSASLK